MKWQYLGAPEVKRGKSWRVQAAFLRGVHSIRHLTAHKKIIFVFTMAQCENMGIYETEKIKCYPPSRLRVCAPFSAVTRLVTRIIAWWETRISDNQIIACNLKNLESPLPKKWDCLTVSLTIDNSRHICTQVTEASGVGKALNWIKLKYGTSFESLLSMNWNINSKISWNYSCHVYTEKWGSSCPNWWNGRAVFENRHFLGGLPSI